MAQKLSGNPFAVVTGASSGIGYELAKQFVEHGFDVLMAAQDDYIKEAAATLRNGEAKVQSLQVDLSTSEGVKELYEEILMSGRPLDSLVINAGIGVSGDFTRQTDLQEELDLISLNVVSPVYLAKLAVKDMVANRHGRIMFTSSLIGVAPAPFMAVYGASKAFIHSFSEALRNELKDTGVTVTALMPGPTDTLFFSRADMEDTKVGQMHKDDPAIVARQGFEAMMKGKDHIVAGSLKVKIHGILAEILPETVKAAMHRRVAQPGSA